MLTLRSSEDHYGDVQRLVALAVAGSRRAWSKLDLADLDASFRTTVGPELLLLVGGAQTAAASLAEPYVDRVLVEQNFGDDGKAGVLVPQAFAGVASDGRPLPSLLRSPLTDAKTLAGQGVADPVQAARPAVDRIVATQVQDAARGGESAVIASRTKVGGYVRQLNPPSCSRCAILAGKWFRWNTGFQRHPQCDCVHVPVAEDAAGELTTNPRTYFDSLTPAEQDRIFTKSGAQAIRDGADIGQVVNARRGMSVSQPLRGAKVTSEGVTYRGYANQAPGSTVGRRGGVRLMPETIYEVAVDRADAVRLLRANGYLR